MLNCKNRLHRLPISVLLVLSLFLGTVLSGCGLNNNKSVSKSSFYFNTIITLTLYGTDKEDAIDECFHLASRYENLLSNTIEGSEISQINALAGSGEYVTVSDETLEVLEDGIRYCELSQGAFDITIGKLSSLWNISEIAASLSDENNEADASCIPSQQAIEEALSTVDYTALEIRGNQVRLNTPGAMLDLGAIAKGFIADKMKDCLKSAGIKSALINLGGNVLTLGSKTNGSDFVVGIQKPFDDTGIPLATVSLSDKSAVTSGIYERYFRVDDKIYHHILDLSTGYPCENELDSVTIISDSSMDGDALSTTCFVLGSEKGMQLIEELDGIEAVFVTENLEYLTSSGLEAYSFAEYK